MAVIYCMCRTELLRLWLSGLIGSEYVADIRKIPKMDKRSHIKSMNSMRTAVIQWWNGTISRRLGDLGIRCTDIPSRIVKVQLLYVIKWDIV